MAERLKTPDLKDMEYDEREDADLEAEVYKNIHDLIGVKGIIRSQQVEVEKKKLNLRMQNEVYLMEHPELHTMVSLFIKKVLDERPQNILEFAGSFFDRQGVYDRARPKLRSIVEAEQINEREQNRRNAELDALTKIQ